jgi:hypothetical protein
LVEPAPDDPTGTPTAPPTTDPAPTPDTGTDYKALYEATIAKFGQVETTAREHQAKAAKLDEIEAANQTEAERATARATAAEQQVTTLRRLAVDAEIRAAASGWAAPVDAPLYLADQDRYLTADGTVDATAITADLAAVLTQRPHLARVDGLRRPGPLAGSTPVRTLRCQRADPRSRGARRLGHRHLAEERPPGRAGTPAALAPDPYTARRTSTCLALPPS